MSNILSFPLRSAARVLVGPAGLISAAAEGRHGPEDVFWLKEVAEALSVLRALGQPVPEAALAPLAQLYGGLEARMSFYPQYYRFFLSIALDLEDLGWPGSVGMTLCARAAAEGLVEAELSDLQRCEAQRLLARRGRKLGDARGVEARLRAFAGRSATFALPNIKAAYELTHIVFYLTDYGRRDARLGPAVRQSLQFAGLIAFLDCNADLLAEICIALRYAGAQPDPRWSAAVAAAQDAIAVEDRSDMPSQRDSYHTYLVTGWARALDGGESGFEGLAPGALRFVSRAQRRGALRPLSARLYRMEERRADWARMRGTLSAGLDAQARALLEEAEASSNEFDAFFEVFARSSVG